MTNLEAFKTLLDEVGQKYEVHDSSHEKWGKYHKDNITIEITGGYSGFFTDIVFNLDESFREIGAYE